MGIVTEKTSSQVKKKSKLKKRFAPSVYCLLLSLSISLPKWTVFISHPSELGLCEMYPCAAKRGQGLETAGMHNPAGADPKPAKVSGMLFTVCSGL